MKLTNKALLLLAIDRVGELGQVVYEAHQTLEKWHPEPLTGMQRTELGLKLQRAVEEQKKWLNAMSDELKDDEE